MWAVVETGPSILAGRCLCPGWSSVTRRRNTSRRYKRLHLHTYCAGKRDSNERAEYGRALQSGNGEDD